VEAYIYGLHLKESTRIRYVGQTVNPSLRLTRHKTDALHDSRHAHFPVYRWIRKHGPNRIQMTILEVTSLDEVDKAERAWIAKFRQEGTRLLNISEGGSAPARGVSPSAETRKKISLALKGIKRSPETRAKMSQARKGTRMTDSAHANHLKAHRSREFKAKMRDIHAARTPEQRTKIALKIWESRRANCV